MRRQSHAGEKRLESDFSPIPPLFPENSRGVNPFLTPLMDMRQHINKALKETIHMAADWMPGPLARVMPKIKVREDDKAFYLTTTLPGLDPDDLEVIINQDHMILKWEERRSQRANGNYSYSQQNCYRTVMLPPNADPERAYAQVKNGDLTIMIRKREETEDGARSLPIEKAA